MSNTLKSNVNKGFNSLVAHLFTQSEAKTDIFSGINPHLHLAIPPREQDNAMT